MSDFIPLVFIVSDGGDMWVPDPSLVTPTFAADILLEDQSDYELEDQSGSLMLEAA